MKRHPNAVIKPPITAVKRVDFRLQIAMVSGDIKRESDMENAPNTPGKEDKK